MSDAPLRDGDAGVSDDSGPVAIHVNHAAKSFRLYRQRRRSLKEVVVSWSLGDWEDLWAVNDVSFSVPSGQTVGIVGHNGSGKTTLLKLLTGIMEPDRGMVHVEGRVSSMLELAAGFQPDYTGRENIYLYGALLGLPRRLVQAKFDEIVEFSGLGRMIGQSVKTYSTGMYVRLGFAVAALLDPDVLLIDEVLAVGDAEFQQKCFRHLETVKQAGKTIVLVSHDLGSVSRFCERAIWMDEGRVEEDGRPDTVVERYLHQSALRASRRRPPEPGGAEHQTTSRFEITRVRFLGAEGLQTTTVRTDEPLTMEISFAAYQALEGIAVNVTMFRTDGLRCFDTPSNRSELFSIPAGEGTFWLHVPRLSLHQGTYQATVAVYSPESQVMYQFHDRLYPVTVNDPRGGRGVAWLDYEWDITPARASLL